MKRERKRRVFEGRREQERVRKGRKGNVEMKANHGPLSIAAANMQRCGTKAISEFECSGMDIDMDMDMARLPTQWVQAI